MHLHRLIIFATFALPTSHVAGQTADMSFNPNGYLSERYATETPEDNNTGGIKTEKVTISGNDYTKYMSEHGTLYIQKTERPDSDPEIYLRCGKGFINPDEYVEHRIALEKGLTQRISVDISFASNIIVKRCGGIVRGLTSPAGEIGVTYKDKKGRSHKIFNRMLQPNLGIQSEF